MAYVDKLGDETVCEFNGNSSDWWGGIIGLIAVAAIFGSNKPVKKLKYMISLTDEQKQECAKCLEDMKGMLNNSLERYKENSVLSGEYIKRQEQSIQEYSQLIQKIKNCEELDDKTWNNLLMMLTICNTYKD